MEQGLSRWGTGLAYQPASQLYVPDWGFIISFSIASLSAVFAFKQEFAPCWLFSPLWFHCKSCQNCLVLVSGWAPMATAGNWMVWTSSFLLADTDGRIGAFRRNFQKWKRNHLSPLSLLGLLWKPLSRLQWVKFQRRDPFSDILKPRAHNSIQGEWCNEHEELSSRVFLTLTHDTTLSRQVISG